MSTRIAIAVVEHAGRFLVGERPAGATLAGYAEFPGGKVEAGESPAEAAARECLEETGLACRVGAPYAVVEHRYPHGEVELHFFACQPCDPEATPQAPFRWMPRETLGTLQFPPANAELLRVLLG